MAKFIVEESRPLRGAVKIGGSKNAVLPIMAASLLCADMCKIHDVPNLTDVSVMKEILTELGAEVVWDTAEENIEINCSNIKNDTISYTLSGKMRASFLVMGSLLARFGKAKIPLPGGCAIGARPVDLHLKGFAALGAKVECEHGYAAAECKQLTGSTIYLDFPSVGATENIMTAATLAKGQTIIQNCAIEPEIVDLANFLSSLGAEIRGAGTDTIRITGVTALKGCEHTVIPDRIEAGTFMAATAATRGEVTITNVVSDHLRPIIAKLREMGVTVSETEGGINVFARDRLLATDIKTLPYPGFPTDMQAQLMSVLISSKGCSVVTETLFENRFMHVCELVRMGADIKIESRTALIEGVEKLKGAQVRATDLRAGASLVIAALSAHGQTEINEISHIERGYCGLDQKLKCLGANIARIE
ncbi:MAG: UDP-N-acetylglucosamine 1-carboxyvinyltransferase [Clostridiales bacterium]|nr:UDP-N-acetylglucosamine 1-carboxyvinyltransferase [Clostridiales bacterium]